METAKVDIRKLQLLNDRINQTIDALSQVRLSVHGLAHTAGINPNLTNNQAAAFGQGAGQQQAGFPPVQQGTFPQVQQPGFPQTGFPQIFGGLSHTPMFYGGAQGGMNPYGAWGVQGGPNPYAGFGGVQTTGGLNPFAGIGGMAGAAGGWNPYLAQVGQAGQFGGLSHSAGPEPLGQLTPRPVWSDPLLAARIAQTFPYAQFAVPPVVTLY
jgi:hypothetical protein